MDDSGLVDTILQWAELEDKKALKKSDGSKTSKLLDVPKLDDAIMAGTKNSHRCTLILTEGDSAKALAVSPSQVHNLDDIDFTVETWCIGASIFNFYCADGWAL